jgi:TetR/AcrR family transcriptional regulator, transcriptional repressor for nem operon
MNETAEKLLDLAEGRIRDAGYGGFSFRELAAEIGIKSASVHHHFPTKALLAAAVARRYRDRFLADVASRSGTGEAAAIGAYRTAFRTALGQDGRMCLCGVLGAEAGGLPPEVTEEVRQFFRACAKDLAERIGSADAEDRALSILATLEGAMILARALGDLGAFDQATARL